MSTRMCSSGKWSGTADNLFILVFLAPRSSCPKTFQNSAIFLLKPWGGVKEGLVKQMPNCWRSLISSRCPALSFYIDAQCNTYKVQLTSSSKMSRWNGISFKKRTFSYQLDPVQLIWKYLMHSWCSSLHWHYPYYVWLSVLVLCMCQGGLIRDHDWSHREDISCPPKYKIERISVTPQNI